MKKIFSAFLCVVLIATTLTACGLLEKPAFVKIDAELCCKDSNAQYMCLKDNLLFVASESVHYDYTPSDDEYECEAPIEKVDNKFVLYDIEKNEIVCQKEKETKNPLYIFKVAFEGDDKIVISHDEKLTYYDYNLNKLETKKCDNNDPNPNEIKDSKFGEDLYCTIDGVYQSYASNFEALIFKNDPNTAFITDKPEFSEYVICNDKKIISQQSKFTDDRSVILSTTLNVYDFENKQLLNSHTFEYEPDNKICNVRVSGDMNATTAVLNIAFDNIINEEDGSCETDVSFYIWDYLKDSTPTSFDVDRYTHEELAKKSNSLADEISHKYDIKINIGEEVPNYDHNLTEDDKFYVSHQIGDFITLYDVLMQADEILENFPEGMVARLDDFNLYMVDWISGCGAYANYTFNDTDLSVSYYVVMSLNSMYDLPHELMHCFDNYIGSNIDGDPLFFPYMQLNPINIFDESFYNNHEEEDKYNFVYNGKNNKTAAFVSDYATTNVQEDKAELFAMLYRLGTDYEKYEEDMDKLKNAPAIRAKAELICKVLREAFPEIKETPVWEKPLERLK